MASIKGLDSAERKKRFNMNSLLWAYKQPAAVCRTTACKHFLDSKVQTLALSYKSGQDGTVYGMLLPHSTLTVFFNEINIRISILPVNPVIIT